MSSISSILKPDINTGWDSSRGMYYNGYDLYMLTACD